MGEQAGHGDERFPPRADAGGPAPGGGSLPAQSHVSAQAHAGDLHRAEDWMQGSEARYRLLFENMLEGFAYCRMLYDEAGHPDDFVYLSVNPAFTRLTGLADVVGKRVTEVIPRVKEETPDLFELYGGVARTGQPVEFEIDFTPLGLWLHVSAMRPEMDHFVAVFTNVTAMKVAERKAADARRLLDEAQAISKLGGWQYDVERDEVSWTEEVYRIHGLGSGFDARDYRRDIGFYAPQSAPLVAEAFRRAVESGEPYDLEVELDRADGERIWVRTVGRPLVEDGAVVRVIGNIMDVSERKAAEEELRFTRFMVERAGDSIFWMDASGVIRYANPATCEALGYSLEELRTMTIHDVDLDFPAERWPQHMEELRQAGTLRFASHHRAKDGAVVPVEIRAHYLEFGGDVYDVGFGRDITERKQAEEKLATAASEWRQTFDAMSDAVALLDAEGRVLRCNTATAQLTNRTFEEIIGLPCHNVFHGSEAWHEACPLLAARQSHASESAVFEQDGRWLRVSFQPLFARQGSFRGGVHVVSDVTALKAAELRLQSSLSQLQTVTEEVIETIVGIVEVRDPYTAGHERRVAELAEAIAAHLGLSKEQVTGVRVAALLHDVGKIVVPSEILAKPGASHRDRVRAHQGASTRRTCDARRDRVPLAGRRGGAAASRAPRRLRLPPGPCRRGDHPRGAHPRRGRCRRGHGLAPALSPKPRPGRRPRGDRAAGRPALRRRGDRGLPRPLSAGRVHDWRVARVWASARC